MMLAKSGINLVPHAKVVGLSVVNLMRQKERQSSEREWTRDMHEGGGNSRNYEGGGGSVAVLGEVCLLHMRPLNDPSDDYIPRTLKI